MTKKSRKLAHKAIIAQEKKRLDDLYSQPLKFVHDYSFTDQELELLEFSCFYDKFKDMYYINDRSKRIWFEWNGIRDGGGRTLYFKIENTGTMRIYINEQFNSMKCSGIFFSDVNYKVIDPLTNDMLKLGLSFLYKYHLGKLRCSKEVKKRQIQYNELIGRSRQQNHQGCDYTH